MFLKSAVIFFNYFSLSPSTFTAQSFPLLFVGRFWDMTILISLMAYISSSNCTHLICRQGYLWAIQNPAQGMPSLCKTLKLIFWKAFPKQENSFGPCLRKPHPKLALDEDWWLSAENFLLQPQPFEGMCCANLRNVIWKLFEDPNSSKAAKVRNHKWHRLCNALRVIKIKFHWFGWQVVFVIVWMVNVGADFF